MAPLGKAPRLPLGPLVLVLFLFPALIGFSDAGIPDAGIAKDQQDLQEPQDPQKKTAPFPRHGKFAGVDSCLTCHEIQADSIKVGHHAAVLQDPSLQACESCHGPGTAHAENEDNETELITFPPALKQQVQVRLCSRCHMEQIQNHGGDMPGFFAAGKTCTSCHKVHQKIPPEPYPGLSFPARLAAQKHAKPVGSKQCTSCHPLRNRLLQESYHRSLAEASRKDGCETCHGPGSLHVETGGLSRLITRPDLAQDGKATCRSCHQHVDPVEFHWKGRHKPLLSSGLTCTSCHKIHKPVLQKLGGEPDRTHPGILHLGRQATKTNAPQRVATNRICMKCHQPAFKILAGTIHESIGKPDQPLHQGCGACHDGASMHANNAGRKQLVDSLHGSNARHQEQVCNKCHGREETMRQHKIGSHFRRGVACLNCHSPAAQKDRVQADAERNCTSCHQDVAADFKKPNRHPVDVRRKDPRKPRLGKMGCTSCHNPHSARPKIRNRVLRFETCVKCHKQYRGPYVFEHQASRHEYCVVCHTPHGSVNKRLLKQVNSQQNCLQCHADFPSFHDQTQGAVFTNCLRCHTEIHGSNIDRFLFR